HSSSRNFRTDDDPTLRLGGGKFHRRKESHFIRVELVPTLDVLVRIERVVPDRARKLRDAPPLFRIRKVRRELIDEARTLLKPECFVPQVSVEQPHHRLTDVPQTKDENVSRLFPRSPEHCYQHFAVVVSRGLNYRRALFADLLPELIKRCPITCRKPIPQGQQTWARWLIVKCSRALLKYTCICCQARSHNQQRKHTCNDPRCITNSHSRPFQSVSYGMGRSFLSGIGLFR